MENQYRVTRRTFGSFPGNSPKQVELTVSEQKKCNNTQR